MVTGRQCDARSGEVCVGLAGQAEPGKWGSVGGGPAVLDVDTHWQEHWGRAASWRSPGWLSLVPGRHRRPSRRGQPRAASCRTRDRRPGLRTATCRRAGRTRPNGRTATPDALTAAAGTRCSGRRSDPGGMLWPRRGRGRMARKPRGARRSRRPCRPSCRRGRLCT